MSRNMQLPYYDYVTAFLQTDLFLVYLFFCERRQFRSSDAVTTISLFWLAMALPREAHTREIRWKSRGKNIVELHAPSNWLLIENNARARGDMKFPFRALNSISQEWAQLTRVEKFEISKQGCIILFII